MNVMILLVNSLMQMCGEHFMQMALSASAIIGVTASYVGVLVVMRRMIFVGIALAYFSSLGIAVAAYSHQDMTTFALIFTVLGVLVMAPRDYARRIPSDALIGIGLASCWALSILFLSKADYGDSEMLNLMKGNILGTTAGDVYLLLVVLGSVLLVHILFFREFLFVSFDREGAAAVGVNARFYNVLFYLTLGISIAFSIKLAGVLLTFAYLLFPAVISSLLTEKIKLVLLVSVVLSLCASAAGLVMSFLFDYPAAPSIVVVLLGLFTVSFALFNLLKLSFVRKALSGCKKS